MNETIVERFTEGIRVALDSDGVVPADMMPPFRCRVAVKALIESALNTVEHEDGYFRPNPDDIRVTVAEDGELTIEMTDPRFI